MRAPRSVNLHTLPSQHAKGLPSAGRGISLIKYGHRNRPSKNTFDDGRTVTYTFDDDGALILNHNQNG
ncbi:MAG: hypothetical protein HDS30_01365 [Bacteroides sp.]|nr:hypothetical protein [Bacteroides sp.]